MKSREVRRKEAEDRQGSSQAHRHYPKDKCQDCKYHTNRPSYCNNLMQFIGRKQTCTDFKRK